MQQEIIQKIYSSKLKGKSIGSFGKSELFLSKTLDLIYPLMLRKIYSCSNEVEQEVNELLSLVEENLGTDPNIDTSSIIEEFSKQIPELMERIGEDADSIYKGDPAASSLEEVILCYPGLLAIATYRIAHFFYQKELYIFSRLLSEIAHERTGIDIHPGAQIGKSFVIDHGTGVVIGETAIIGDQVKIYQGVTLGALSVEKDLARKKRHPTIEDECVIYAHATILGGKTTIGRKSVIGGNVWLTKSVAPHSLVYHKSEIKVDTTFKEEELTYEI